MHDALRRALSLSAVAALGATLWHAGAEARGVSSMDLLRSVVAPAGEGLLTGARTQVARVAAPRPPQIVWEGLDVDGDGAPDFVNPTGESPRGWDGFGGGHFGASRGHRQHEGVDYVARAGQNVAAPISGFITKIGYAYAGDDLRFVEISNPALNYTARVFYVNPDVSEGQSVALGDPIGTVATLQDRYAGITDHVHLEIAESGRRVDATNLILAQVKTDAARG